MSAKFVVGDVVVCRLYNTPTRKFIGDEWRGQIMEIAPHSFGINPPEIAYSVFKPGYRAMWLHRKEILRRVA